MNDNDWSHICIAVITAVTVIIVSTVIVWRLDTRDYIKAGYTQTVLPGRQSPEWVKP